MPSTLAAGQTHRAPPPSLPPLLLRPLELACPCRPLQVLFTQQADATMAVELDVCHTLLQWPYLTDMSLISAMVAIFQPGWCTGPKPFLDTLQMQLNPWLYINVVVRQSQVRRQKHALGHTSVLR